LSAVFSSGSAIRAKDLNDNFTQNLYVTQEVNNNALNVDGSNPMVGNLNMNGYQIDNLGEPTSDSDAATKKYIDDRYGNLSIPGFTRWSKTAVGGETTLSGVGTTGGTLGYSPNREQVYLNGAQLQRDADYTANNGTSIVLNVALIAGDVLEVICVNNLNTGTTAQAQDVYWNQSGSGAVTRTVESKLRDVVSVKDFGAVGDGVADDTAAISTAMSSGTKRLFFPPGTYIVGHIYKTGLTGLELFGAPGKSVIKKKAGTYSVNVDGAIAGIIDFVSCSDITLRGLKIDGNKLAALPSGGTHLNGVNFYTCNIVRTKDCEFVDVEFQGLNHQCTDQVWVVNNKFLLCGWAGVGFTGGYFTTYGAETCVIANNYFESIWAGVQCQISTTYVNIENNRFKNSSLIFAQDVRYATISGNTFDGVAPSGALGEAAQDAITIESDYNITITGNTINRPARHGIYVVGNYIENGPSEGILTCNDVVISGNVITNTIADGINFTPGSAFTYNMGTHTASAAVEANFTYAQNGLITNNVISLSGGSGIVLGIAQNTKVDGNVISKSVAHGIIVGSNKSVFITNNTIRNNSQAGADTYDGITLSGSVSTLANIVIDGNTIFDDQTVRTQRYGVYNPNASADLKAFNNTFKNNGTDFSSSSSSLPFSIQNSPTFLNGASSFGSGFETPGYYIDSDGIVHLRGMVLLGASGVGNPIFTLPVGMRPRNDEMFTVLANSALGRCDITSSGNVVATAGTNNQWFNLSGISFAANR
jgi:parallel beta-helix repeat protein